MSLSYSYLINTQEAFPNLEALQAERAAEFRADQKAEKRQKQVEEKTKKREQEEKEKLMRYE